MISLNLTDPQIYTFCTDFSFKLQTDIQLNFQYLHVNV